MSLAISGLGWVTPLGTGVGDVWARLLAGEAAVLDKIASPLGERSYPVYRVPAAVTATFARQARLRRSSAISHFAVAAGLAALDDAGLEVGPGSAGKIALIFAISNGGVIYTGRFFNDIVKSGAQGASPLLFPETVFNAPASHLAAVLGLTGASYTLVGDGAVSVLALKMAEDLMQSGAIDHCLVVAAEEADWLLCDAYRQWRLLRTNGGIEPFRRPPAGMILSEGAGAVLVSRAGPVSIEKIHGGSNFCQQRDAARVVRAIVCDLAGQDPIDLAVASANGTFIDAAEEAAFVASCPSAPIYTCKPALGEAVAAGGIWQVIAAAQALRTGHIPPFPSAGGTGLKLPRDRPVTRALVSVCGLNQQAAGLSLAMPHD